jgi:hypothetical protein
VTGWLVVTPSLLGFSKNEAMTLGCCLIYICINSQLFENWPKPKEVLLPAPTNALVEIRVDTIVLHDTLWRVRKVVRFQEKEVFPIKKEDIAVVSPVIALP